MKTGLVLSGGGAKGAFQVGALTKLYEKGVTFDVVSGVSVGSLNGAMVAQDKFDDLRKIWETISNDSVYRKYSKIRILFRNLFGGKKSLYDNSPLLELISKNVKIEDFKKKFYLGFTSLYDAKYHCVCVEDFETSEDLHKGILASTLMPIVWEPITVKAKGKEILQCVDGGVRNVTPLSDIIDEMPDKIYIITCKTDGVSEKRCSNIIQVTSRIFSDIINSELVDDDIREFININNLVLQARDKGFVLTSPTSGKEYKYFEAQIIDPPQRLGSAIEFEKEAIKKYFQYGYDIVK